jgi:hypothetical protein
MKQTNMIEKVEELRELEVKATPGECIVIEDDDRSGDFIIIQSKEHWAWKDGSNSPDAKYLAAMRNAAPKMIAALGKIREGDANEIDYAIQELSRIFGQGNIAETIEVLNRYRDMARMMEDKDE